MNWRYGPHNATIMYPRLLIKLTDLRELNDQHNEYNLKLAKQEVRLPRAIRSSSAFCCFNHKHDEDKRLDCYFCMLFVIWYML